MKTLFLLLVLAPCAARSQMRDSLQVRDEAPSSFRRTVSVGMVAGSLALSVVWAFDEWWKGKSYPFHFLKEGWFDDYSLGIDKLGHAYTSYFYFNMFHTILLWGGHDEEDAFWWATGASAAFAIGVEVGDGITDYGFSYEDLTANMLGLGFGILRVKVPFMRNFSFKWSYIPEPGYNAALRFTRHYDGHTYWLAFNVHDLLPEGLQSWWPSFLQLAAGYSVADGQTRREGVIGLDFNLEIFQPPNRDIALVQKVVNMIHLPAPGIKFPEGRPAEFKLLYTN